MEAMDQLLELFDLAPELNFGTNKGWAPGKLFLAGVYAVLAPDRLFSSQLASICIAKWASAPGQAKVCSSLICQT